MNRGRRKPAERAIIYAAVVGGLTIEQTKEMLIEAGFGGRIPKTSWEMLNRVYLPQFLSDPNFLGESIYKPLPMGALKSKTQKSVKGSKPVKKRRK